MLPEQAFASVLRRLRTERGISQEKLASLSDLDRTFISLLERGLRQPSLRTLLQLSEALELPAHEFMELVEEKIAGKSSDLK